MVWSLPSLPGTVSVCGTQLGGARSLHVKRFHIDVQSGKGPLYSPRLSLP